MKLLATRKGYMVNYTKRRTDMERYLDIVVTASVRIKFDDNNISHMDAYEQVREELNTNLELNEADGIEIEDVRLDAIELN